MHASRMVKLFFCLLLLNKRLSESAPLGLKALNTLYKPSTHSHVQSTYEENVNMSNVDVLNDSVLSK